MISFAAAYVLVWLGLLAYLVRLGAAQRRLEQAVRALRAELQPPELSPDSPPAPHCGKEALT
jgi:CcmD family protein